MELPIKVYAKDQPQYIPLPCFALGDPQGTITIRWQLSWKERFEVFLGGSIWHQVLTFGHRLQPIKITTECPLVNIPDDAGE